MAVNVKHPDADRLVRDLCERTGQSITDVVLHALREEHRRLTGRRRVKPLREELLEIGERCAALPDFDRRTPEDIIGFDEHGIPN